MGATGLEIVSGVLSAVAFGSMVFFAAVVAPLIFTRLPEDVALNSIQMIALLGILVATLGG